MTFFGLQYLLKRYLEGPVVTKAKIDYAEKIVNSHMGQGEMKHFNREGWEYILNKHGGRLPIKIKAVPEGMTVPNKNVLMTVENTDPKCFWLTNYLETLLVQVREPPRALFSLGRDPGARDEVKGSRGMALAACRCGIR